MFILIIKISRYSLAALFALGRKYFDEFRKRQLQSRSVGRSRNICHSCLFLGEKPKIEIVESRFLFFCFLLIHCIGYSQTSSEYYKSGNAKVKSKDYRGAIVDYNRAIEINPRYVEAYFQRALSKSDLKDTKGAIEDYTKVIELQPDHAQAYVGIGIEKDVLKDYVGAIASYSKAIEFNSKHATAYYLRGIDKLILEREESGCLDLSKARALGYIDPSAVLQQYCR